MRAEAHSYASALFALAQEKNEEGEILSQLEQLDGILRENYDFVKLLDCPAIPTSERTALLDEAFCAAHEYVLNFLKVLCEDKCAKLFSQCVKEYKKEYEEKSGIAHYTAVTTAPLSARHRARLIEKLEKESGKTVILEETVDKSIIGGIILKGENNITDASVSARLKALREELLSASIMD